MYQLVIDKDICTGCGACEASMPKLLEEAIDGRLFISPTKFMEQSVKVNIDRAIKSCKFSALTMEEVE